MFPNVLENCPVIFHGYWQVLYNIITLSAYLHILSGLRELQFYGNGKLHSVMREEDECSYKGSYISSW